MNTEAALRDHPIIETGVEVDDGDPDLEDYVASYGGAALVDELRSARRTLDGRGERGRE